MGERRVVKHDLHTGETAEHVTRTPPATLQERIDQLQAISREHLNGDPIASYQAVYCDQCGQVADLDASRQLPDGWTTDHRGEICPDCNSEQIENMR